jgi:hypothetical protein
MKEMNAVTNFDSITCRLAIQVCVGHFPDGRERHRTISIKNINPNAEVSALNALVRAIAPLLAYPITKVRQVTKKICALSGSLTENAPAPVIESRVIDLAEPAQPDPLVQLSDAESDKSVEPAGLTQKVQKVQKSSLSLFSFRVRRYAARLLASFNSRHGVSSPLQSAGSPSWLFSDYSPRSG